MIQALMQKAMCGAAIGGISNAIRYIVQELNNDSQPTMDGIYKSIGQGVVGGAIAGPAFIGVDIGNYSLEYHLNPASSGGSEFSPSLIGLAYHSIFGTSGV